jgi:hypothetical protein
MVAGAITHLLERVTSETIVFWNSEFAISVYCGAGVFSDTCHTVMGMSVTVSPKTPFGNLAN